ncbi:MAG TPA: DUF6526 family protein [Vicinamibacterales bacterium]|nr:DUF6526 family protein [Vicinamibacterales bacterium]
MAAAQTFENHTRFVPAYHYVALPIFAINVLWNLYVVARHPSAGSAVGLLVAIALVILALFARVFALTAQDRVIRLEMRFRLAERLPAALQPRIPDFTIDQLVALRFAGDDELADLAEAVLRDNLTDRTAIKKMVTRWRADLLRV